MDENKNTVLWSLETLDDLQEKDPQTTLFVIGNGFDILHKVPSRYVDFRKWLNLSGYGDIVDELESSINSDSLWFNFEIELGDFSINHNLGLVPEGLDMFDAYDPDAQAADFFIAVEFATNSFRELIQKLKRAFSQWIASLTMTPGFAPLEDILLPDAFYLTFNYTEFLETQYAIPEMNICYLHGCRKKRNTPLIFGHPEDTGLDGDTTEPYYPVFHEQRKNQLVYDAQEVARDYLATYDDDITKKTFSVIQAHKCFFQAQAGVMDVIVIGHSLSIVDYPYFKHLLQVFKNPGAVIWHITYYSAEDLERIWLFVERMDIHNNQVRLIQME